MSSTAPWMLLTKNKCRVSNQIDINWSSRNRITSGWQFRTNWLKLKLQSFSKRFDQNMCVTKLWDFCFHIHVHLRTIKSSIKVPTQLHPTFRWSKKSLNNLWLKATVCHSQIACDGVVDRILRLLVAVIVSVAMDESVFYQKQIDQIEMCRQVRQLFKFKCSHSMDSREMYFMAVYHFFLSPFAIGAITVEQKFKVFKNLESLLPVVGKLQSINDKRFSSYHFDDFRKVFVQVGDSKWMFVWLARGVLNVRRVYLQNKIKNELQFQIRTESDSLIDFHMSELRYDPIFESLLQIDWYSFCFTPFC